MLLRKAHPCRSGGAGIKRGLGHNGMNGPSTCLTGAVISKYAVCCVSLHQKPQIELTVQYLVYQCRLHTGLARQHTGEVKKFVCSPKFDCAAFWVPLTPGVGSNAETDVHVVLDRTTFRRTRTPGASSRTYMFALYFLRLQRPQCCWCWCLETV